MDFDKELTIVDFDLKMVEGNTEIQEQLYVSLNVMNENGIHIGEIPLFQDFMINWQELYRGNKVKMDPTSDTDYTYQKIDGWGEEHIRTQLEKYYGDVIGVVSVELEQVDRNFKYSFQYYLLDDTDTILEYTS